MQSILVGQSYSCVDNETVYCATKSLLKCDWKKIKKEIQTTSHCYCMFFSGTFTSDYFKYLFFKVSFKCHTQKFFSYMMAVTS